MNPQKKKLLEIINELHKVTDKGIYRKTKCIYTIYCKEQLKTQILHIWS